MKTFNPLLLALFTLALSASSALAQQPQTPPNWGNMDPQQMQQMIQQRVMDALRTQLAITNDAEWGIIQERLSKVLKLRMEAMTSGGGMGMMAAMRRNNANGQGGGFRGFPGFGQPDPNSENLQKALDAGAPVGQIKTALEKVRDARKQKQAELAKAQADLRGLLTVRQEAALVLVGMLE